MYQNLKLTLFFETFQKILSLKLNGLSLTVYTFVTKATFQLGFEISIFLVVINTEKKIDQMYMFRCYSDLAKSENTTGMSQQ